MSDSYLTLAVGERAPAWQGQVIGDGAEETLGSETLRGQAYILYFYPKDNTPGCTAQACDFRDHMSRVESLGYRVIGCSPDSLRSHENFQSKHSFSFSLISDPDHSIAEAFGVWREKKNYGRTYMGITRSTFVVSPQGTLLQVMENVRAKGHVERLISLLQADQGE